MYDESVTILQQSINSSTGCAEAYCNLGDVQQLQGKTDEAICSYRRACRIKPSFTAARWGELLTLPVLYDSAEEINHARNRWREGVKELLDTIDLGSTNSINDAKIASSSSTNFYLNYQGLDDLDMQILYGKLLTRIANAAYPEYSCRDDPGLRKTGDRIRIGFVSSFLFHNHSILKTHGRWITELDHKIFDVHVFFTGQAADKNIEAISRQGESSIYHQ